MTGWKSGIRSPGSRTAAARASVAITTARAEIRPCAAVSTPSAAIEVTCTPSRTVPGGSPSASCAGTAAIPPAGRQSRPRAYERSTRSATRLLVPRAGSLSSAPSSGRSSPSTVRGARPRSARAWAVVVSGLVSRRETGVVASLLSAVPSLALSSGLPNGPRAAACRAVVCCGSPTR